ncbi:Uu.00g071650.m01.CDS01 [Anthostomella pinea]|uniref:Uu.00g071650.m01.CDS01 n=1 Tax=Anthostomella pinea TaxID=933095 RepID=A0AAI8YNU0_9PEZI|nr:Uu.00g071650.m01.CDS01 [Anthostomella pinea]
MLLWCTTTLFLIVFAYYEYRSWKRLAHIPGPLAAHFSIYWLLRHAWTGNLFPCLIEAGDRYGELVRIGPNLLLCSDPDELRRISGIRSEYTKGPAYDAGCVTDGEPHVASERDPVKHKALRGKMGPGYSVDVQPAIDRHVSAMVSLMERKYVTEPGRQDESPARFMDFGQKTHFYALDCIGDFVFGESFGCLRKDEDVHRMTEINDLSLRMVTVAGLVPWLPGLRSRWPFTYLLPKEGDKVGFGMLFGFAKDLVDRRTVPGAMPKSDMLQSFIRSGMTREQLMQQVYIHIIAGSDTSSNWARMTMLCLLTCPPSYLALQREIDASSASGRLSFPTATDAETRTLPYLDAVLRESMRLHPPSVSPSKLSPSKQRARGEARETVCGFDVPDGTQVGANVPGILRSTVIFGPDAGCFRPERWLETAGDGSGERISRMKQTLDIVFGAGEFQCMGKAIAWMEVRKLFVELMRRFDFCIINNLKPLHLESLAIMVVHDFSVRVIRRMAT